MKVLGVRTAPTQLRYALLFFFNSDVTFLNKDSEHLIKVPANLKEDNDKLVWQKREIDRVLRQNSDTSKVILKVGEYGKSDSKSNRLAAYFDAAVILSVKEVGIEVETKIYVQLQTKRSQVKNDAEAKVAKTSKYWNEQIADAILAALSARTIQ
ncbi:MAG: hypothetical protein AAFY57_18115 [Cyanobacteria bacterium J06642_2]